MTPFGRHPVVDSSGRYAGAIWVLSNRGAVGPLGTVVVYWLCRWAGQSATFEVAQPELDRMLGRQPVSA